MSYQYPNFEHYHQHFHMEPGSAGFAGPGIRVRPMFRAMDRWTGGLPNLEPLNRGASQQVIERNTLPHTYKKVCIRYFVNLKTEWSVMCSFCFAVAEHQ